MEERICGIYCIENIVNGKKYVGQSVDIERRMNDSHSGCPALYYAFKKYGEENFEKRILEECPEDFLDEREIYWIKKLHSHSSEGGYNILWGGNSGSKGIKLSDETKKKISDAGKGKVTSEETKKKISISKTGIKRSEESIRKTREGNKGKKRSKEIIEKIRISSTGRKHSDESKNKISKANKGTKKSEEEKKRMSESRTGKIRSEESKIKQAKTLTGKKRKNSTSIYIGVSLDRRSNRWVAWITLNKKIKQLGSFLIEIEAAQAYDKYIIDNNLDRPLNFPNDTLN